MKIRTLIPFLALLGAAPSLAAAQSPPRYTLTERLRLDASTEDFSAFTLSRQGNAPFYVSPRNEIVLPLLQDGNVRVYDSTGKRIATLGRKGEGPGEFRSIFRLGFTRDTLWVYDASLRRMTFYDRKYALLRTSIFSQSLRQAADGPDPHVISDFAPSAIMAGGNTLGQIIVVNGRGSDDRLRFTYHIASVGPDAAVKQLADIPAHAVSPRAYVSVDGPARIAYAIVPFGNDALYAFSSTGDRFALVTTNRAARTFNVTVRRSTGDTIFSRSYPFSPRPIPAAIADSAAAAATKNARQSADVIARLTAEVRDSIPPHYPPIPSIVLARDGTTWLRLNTPGDEMAMVLDPKGNVSAMVPLKRSIDIVEADGRRVWAVDVDADGLASVVVFDLTPAKR